MEPVFDTWADSEECYAILHLCARQVIRRANKLSLQLDDNYLDADDYLAAVTAQLWQFMREHADSIAKKATVLLISGDESAFMTYLAQAFLADCVDKRRVDSPFHSYYRHMRAVLSREESIRYEPQGLRGSYYAYSQDAALTLLPERFLQDEFADWNKPALPFRDIHQRSAMLTLSRHFWDESLRHLLAEYLLPIRDLVRFLTLSYPIIFTVTTESESDTPDDDAADPGRTDRLHCSAESRIQDAWKRHSPALDLDIIDSQLDMLAQDCAAELSDRQKTALHLHDQELTLEEIARQLGEKGASNVHYHLKKARTVLKRRWSLWGPPLLREFSEVDEEEFFLFYEKVISFCKKGSEARSL